MAEELRSVACSDIYTDAPECEGKVDNAHRMLGKIADLIDPEGKKEKFLHIIHHRNGDYNNHYLVYLQKKVSEVIYEPTPGQLKFLTDELGIEWNCETNDQCDYVEIVHQYGEIDDLTYHE